jgi:hypothetical protein
LVLLFNIFLFVNNGVGDCVLSEDDEDDEEDDEIVVTVLDLLK